MTVPKAQVGNIDQRMEMLTEQLHACVSNFHNPIAFIAQVDSLIQALRNFTFAIQANKSNIVSFDKWYGHWQAIMKSDEYLKWLGTTRTNVVHKDIQTTESHALLTLNPDHLVTINTAHFDIMKTTQAIIETAMKKADKEPEYKHTTGVINRYYYFDVNGDLVNVLDMLSAAHSFMRLMYLDLVRYIHSGILEKRELPPLKGSYQFPVEKLSVTFKLRDGSILGRKIIPVDVDSNIQEKVKERYGEFKTTHSLKSRSYKERLRAQFDIASKVFNSDGHHIPLIQYHAKKGWGIMSPVFRDRAEKILTMRNVAEMVEEEEVDKLIFTSEAWIYRDVERGLKQINSGKEIRALRNKEEILEVYYIDRTGKFFVISAPIIRSGEKVLLGSPTERTEKPENMPLFAPIFAKWGIIEAEYKVRKMPHNPNDTDN